MLTNYTHYLQHRDQEGIDRFWIAVFNNIPELLLGGLWTVTMLWIGYRIGARLTRRKYGA